MQHLWLLLVAMAPVAAQVAPQVSPSQADGPRPEAVLGNWRWQMPCHTRRMCRLGGGRVAMVGCRGESRASEPSVVVLGPDGSWDVAVTTTDIRTNDVVGRGDDLWVTDEAGELHHLHARTGRVVATTRTHGGFQSIALAGSWLCAWDGSTMSVFDAATLAKRGEIDPSGIVLALHGLEDGRLVLYTSTGIELRSARLGVIAHHELDVCDNGMSNSPRRILTARPDGLVAAADDATVWLWDVDRGAPRAWLSIDATIDALCFTPDGTGLVVADHARGVRCVDLASGRCRWRQTSPPAANEIMDLVYTADGTLLVGTTVLDLIDGSGRFRDLGPRIRGSIDLCAWVGDRPLTCSRGGTVTVWRDGVPCARHQIRVEKPVSMPNGDLVLIANNQLQRIDAEGRLAAPSPRVAFGGRVVAAAARPGADGDPRVVAIVELAAPGAGVRAVTVRQDGAIEETRELGDKDARCHALSRSGAYALLTRVPGEVITEAVVIELRTGRAVTRALPRQDVLLHAVDDTGAVLYSDCARTARTLRRLPLEGKESIVATLPDAWLSVLPSPDGRWVLASDPVGIRAWIAEVGTRRCFQLLGHRRDLGSAAWSADGTRLLTGGSDKIGIVWRMPAGRR